MFFYRACLSYTGTGFHGWQVQPKDKTIQGELEKALRTICKSEEVTTIASGRTDAGVHANNQIVKIIISKDFSCENLIKALNSLVDDQIFIKSIEKCTEDFHPVFSAKSKKYEYLFSVDKMISIHLKELIYIHPLNFDESLAQEACQKFIGEHDFKNFMTVGTPVSSTIREIYSCEFLKIKNHDFWQGEIYKISIEGNGFLKQMVRLIAGAIFSIAREKSSLEDLERALKAETEFRVGPVAPPQGLYLQEVFY